MSTELAKTSPKGFESGGYKPTDIVSADPASIAAAESAKQRFQAAYVMAKTYPRNQDQSRQNILDACRRPMFAEKAEYSKPVGGSKITGPSIRFAELALREWGNVISDSQVVYENDEIRRLKVYLTDLETNTQFTKEICVNKTVERKSSKGREVISERTNSYGDKVYIVKATDDELLNKEAALISKALRNEGLRLIPGDIIEEALEVATETRSKKTKADPDAQKRKVVDAFSGIGIKVKDIELYLGHSISQVSPKEIDDLRSVYQSVKDGECAWSEYVADKDKSGRAKNIFEDEPKPAEKVEDDSDLSAADKLADEMLNRGYDEKMLRDEAIAAGILPEDFEGSVLKAETGQIEKMLELVKGGAK